MSAFDRYRSEFPVTERYTFLNHASISPPPSRVVEAVTALVRDFGLAGNVHYPQWMERVLEVRRLCARLLNAAPGEIAFVGNTSDGLSAVAAGIGWRAGDVVLVPRPEFPANVYPWMNLERRGVGVRFLERSEGRLGVAEVERSLTPGARLLSVSSVDFATGFLADLEALGDLCRRKGLLFCVDAIQSLGVVPMDVKKAGIHFLAAGGHKWLLSTMGCGILYVSSEANGLIHPERVGWKSVVEEADFFRIHFDLKPDALRFETGTPNVAGIHGLGAAVELLLEAGIDQVHQHVMGLNDELFRGLKSRGLRVVTPMGEGERSGILCFEPGTDPQGLFAFMSENRVVLSPRGRLIRLSPHFYNNGDDLERFFAVLDRYNS